MLAVLYGASPNVKLPKRSDASAPGPCSRCVLWIVVSALFAFYVANFGSYNKTYGTLGRGHRRPAVAVAHEHRGPAAAPR